MLLSAFSINCNPTFSNDPISLPRNFSECTILGTWIFGNFISADKSFAFNLYKALIFSLLVMIYVEN